MAFRVFLTGSGIARPALRVLEQEHCEYRVGDPKDTPDDLIRQLRDFDPHALIVRQGKITAEVQAAAPSLRVICKHGVGLDNIDVDAATRRGIPVLFTPGANFESAAEHTLALMLALLRRVPAYDRRIRSGMFDKKPYDGQELLGRTLGLIGYGRIGRRVAELVAPFRMRVLVYHPSATRESLPDYIRKVNRPEDLYPEVDVLSLHCPLTAETQHMIRRDVLQRMKRGVYIINTARGGLVQEADLLEALQSGQVAGAALDVFEEEPLPAEHPFYRLDNVILSPHVAGSSDNSLINMGMQSVRQVLAVLKGEPVHPQVMVNRIEPSK